MKHIDFALKTLHSAIFFVIFLVFPRNQENVEARGGCGPLTQAWPREQEHPSLARVHAQSRQPKPLILYTAVFAIYLTQVHRPRSQSSLARVQVKVTNPPPFQILYTPFLYFYSLEVID